MTRSLPITLPLQQLKCDKVELSRSQFGPATEIADTSCVAVGVRRALPEAEIIPTEKFWAQVAEGRETMPLPEAFTEDARTRLQRKRLNGAVVSLAE